MKIYEVLVDKKAHNIKILKGEYNSFQVDINGKTFEVKFSNSGDGKFSLELNGEKFSVELLRISGNVMQIKVCGKVFDVRYPTPTFKPVTPRIEPSPTLSKKPAVGFVVGKDAVLAPIAGRIISLKVGVGQKVSKGDCLCILEAMKMANEVAAPRDGIVKEVLVSEGAVVNKGDVLAIII